MSPGREQGQDDPEISNTTEWMGIPFLGLENTSNLKYWNSSHEFTVVLWSSNKSHEKILCSEFCQVCQEMEKGLKGASRHHF